MDLGKAPASGTISLILLTAAISTLIGIFGKRVAENVLDILLRPIKLLFEHAYRYIAPRNPFSISMRSYRKHVLRSNLTRMENPVGPNLEVPLEHAFAPLKLRSSKTQESIDLFIYAKENRRCIVLGGPGTGKTTLMKSLITSVLRKRCHPDLDDLIPVFVVLRNLAKKQQTVEQAIVSAFSDHHFPGAESFVVSSLGAGKMIIILDGLDEVGSSRDFVVEQILNFCQYDSQRDNQNRLFVTCREHSYRSRDLHGEIQEIVQVEPFANHHMRVLLEGWPMHKGRSAIALYATIQGDPQIRDICRNPLLLTILTGLYLDTDNFQLPSSRERFYQNAIDELLVQRPARRQIKQTFTPDSKKQILERVALERLETVDQTEDPEEFTHENIRRMAEAVLQQDNVDMQSLINELVEINGVIKPASENNFTCAHRTIQEYFAAREAMRRRNTSEVVAIFGGRPELIEVLYFYCGLLENLPALESIVSSLTKQRRWVEAGRSLLHMKEAPNSEIVRQVASELCDLIKYDAKDTIEVLSSLANRRDPEFRGAKSFFASAIDYLAGSNEAGASALESAIATSPEIALKLIPGLLRHSSERWKATGVQLLRDIGTDEALDQLVQLLDDKDNYVRSSAGKVLAGIMKSRSQALRQRAALLPERKDRFVWPLEPFFPGSIAIPIAESLAPGGESENKAINCAILALRSRTGSDKTLKRWRQVPSHAYLQHFRRHAGKLTQRLGIIFGLTVALLMGLIQIYSLIAKRVIVVSEVAPYFTTVDSTLYGQVIEKARVVVQEIKARHPSGSSLPWKDKPSIPNSKIEAFRRVGSIGDNPGTPGLTKQQVVAATEIAAFASPASAQNLSQVILLWDAKISKLNGCRCIAVGLPMSPLSALSLYSQWFLYWFAIYTFWWRWRFSFVGIRFKTIIIYILLFVVTLLPAALLVGPALPRFMTAIITWGCIFFGLVIARFPWPNNPLVATLDDVMQTPSRNIGHRDASDAGV